MEETKPVRDPTLNPPPPPPPPEPLSQPSMPPPPPPVAAPPPPTLSKKRPLESSVMKIKEESSYLKMRGVVRDIRPLLLQVIRTVDFRSCKEAQELKEKLKLLIELYKQMTAERATTTRSMDGHTFSGENKAGRGPLDQLQNGKPADQPQPDRFLAKPSESKAFQSVNASEKLKTGDGDDQGTYMVGGSAFGWNFITFTGNKPIYYGRTKESFRATQVNP